jgi:hypothetical protein
MQKQATRYAFLVLHNPALSFAGVRCADAEKHDHTFCESRRDFYCIYPIVNMQI